MLLIRLSIKNFFIRFKYFFICLGILLGALILVALIFVGGMQYIFSLQEGLSDSVENYFLNQFYIKDVWEILNLSIIERVYNDIMGFAGSGANEVKLHLFILLGFCFVGLYGAFKGSIALINFVTKKKVTTKFTKSGLVPVIIKIIMCLLFSLLLTVLLSLSSWSTLSLIAIYLIVDSVELLFNTYYVYFHNEDIKEFLNLRNSFKISGLFIVSQGMLFVIATLLWLISPIIALFIVVPLLAYNSTNIQYSIVTYYSDSFKEARNEEERKRKIKKDKRMAKRNNKTNK